MGLYNDRVLPHCINVVMNTKLARMANAGAMVAMPCMSIPGRPTAFSFSSVRTAPALVGGGLADGGGHVERVEVAGVEEAVDGREIDVVGIHVIGARPA